MKLRYIFYDNLTFCLSTNRLEDIYAFINYKWCVQPFQVKFNHKEGELYNVVLTNKLGEDFAAVGYLKDIKCNPTQL